MCLLTAWVTSKTFEVSFEATEARVYVAVNGPSKWLNELFQVRTTRGASVHVSYEFSFMTVASTNLLRVYS